MKYTISQIKNAMLNKGFSIVEKPFGINIVAIRSKSRDIRLKNDFMYVFFWNREKKLFIYEYSCSTTPTAFWLLNPTKKAGCAVLHEGQYENTWVIGLHNGKHEALLQRRGKVKVYRDFNKDEKVDFDELHTEVGMFGINIHRLWASYNYRNDKSSAGCQVLSQKDIEQLLLFVKQDQRINKTQAFSYTLLKEEDL